MYALGTFCFGLFMFIVGKYETRPFWHWFDMIFGIFGMLPLAIIVLIGTLMVTLLAFGSYTHEQPPEDDL